MMEYKAYFQTTPMGKELLIKCNENAIKQEDGVAMIFKGTRRRMSPSEVLDLYPKDIPITSIRRAITQLTNKGVLIMTEATKKGKWGRPEHLWIHADYEHLI